MEHTCQNCGEVIPKRNYESINRYKARKFCSLECSHAFMRTNKIGWFGSSIGTSKRESKNESKNNPQ